MLVSKGVLTQSEVSVCKGWGRKRKKEYEQISGWIHPRNLTGSPLIVPTNPSERELAVSDQYLLVNKCLCICTGRYEHILTLDNGDDTLEFTYKKI